MDSVKIIVRNEEGKELNPFGNNTPHWLNFESAVKPYPAPAIKDGTHMARLQWQFYRIHGGFWVSADKEVCEQYGKTRQIWVLSPDGEGEKKTDEQIELLKKDFFGSADYLSGVNDGMYHLKAHTIELKISDFCVMMEDVERAFCFGYITNPDNNCLDNAEMMRRWQAFKTEYLDHKIIE